MSSPRFCRANWPRPAYSFFLIPSDMASSAWGEGDGALQVGAAARVRRASGGLDGDSLARGDAGGVRGVAGGRAGGSDGAGDARGRALDVDDDDDAVPDDGGADGVEIGEFPGP